MGSIKKMYNVIKKYPFIGPILWTFTIEYFIVTLVVARAWTTPYSFLHNSISDLGNASCGIYSKGFASGVDACSPRQTLMNWSFIVTGMLMISGGIFISSLFTKSRTSLTGFACIALGGMGAMLVGIFPENTIGILHGTGAFLDFFVGNLGLVVLGFSLFIPKRLKIYTLITGFLTLICLFLYFIKVYFGVGLGGMERLVSYPQTVWLIVFGVCLLARKTKRSEIG